MAFVFNPPPQASIRIRGQSQAFPVHRVYCVGRNFAEHAKEMGAETPKGQPVLFMKPADAVIQTDGIAYPSATRDLHHEVELVLALGPDIPANITLENAQSAIYAYAVGLDLTRRDLQAYAKENRLPWDTAKGFDASAPISELVLAGESALSEDSILSLQVNGQLRQHGRLGDMIYSASEVLLALSGLFQLRPGDLIFMGTPSGVASMVPGDHFVAELHGVVSFSGTII
jgi:fumarylpyruvate hydrolase